MNKPVLAVIVMEGSDISPWQQSQVGVPRFEALGVDVLIFDASPLARREQAGFAGLEARIDQARAVMIFSYYDLRASRMQPLAQLLQVRNIPWTFVQTGIIPAPLPPRDMREKIAFALFQMRRMRRSLGIAGIVRTLLEKLTGAGAKENSHAFKYALVDGLKSEASVAGSGARIIPGHSRDYENKLSRGVDADTSPEDVCVFIDTNEARHSDWLLQGVAESELPDDEQYVRHLLKTFELVEQVTGLKVVVVPHPRFTYPPERFGRFELRPGDTMRTVANAKLVLGHYSTALSFAVIFDKPIILLTDALFHDCMGGRIDRHIRAFAQAFGCHLVRMDAARPDDFQDWQAIDKRAYAQYRADWIQHPDNPPGSMWDLAVHLIARTEGIALPGEAGSLANH